MHKIAKDNIIIVENGVLVVVGNIFFLFCCYCMAGGAEFEISHRKTRFNIVNDHQFFFFYI